MTELVVDFGKLLQEAKAGAAWPEGDYDFEIIESEAVISGNGSPMVRCKIRCLAGTYANKTMTNNFVLTIDNPIALKMFFRQMKALGLDENFFLQIGHGDLRPVARALLNRRATFTLAHREWPAGSGELSNNVVNVKPLGAGSLAGMPPAAMPTMVPPPPGFGAQQQPQPGYGGFDPAQMQPPAPSGLDVFKQPDQQQPLPSGAAFGQPQQPMPGMVPPPPQPPMQPPMPQQPMPQQPMQPPQQPQTYAPQQQTYAPPQAQPQTYAPQQQYAPQPQATNGSAPPPPGFSAEQWATFPEATKQAIIASQQPITPPQPI